MLFIKKTEVLSPFKALRKIANNKNNSLLTSTKLIRAIFIPYHKTSVFFKNKKSVAFDDSSTGLALAFLRESTTTTLYNYRNV